MRTLRLKVSDSEYDALQKVATARKTSLEQVLQEALVAVRSKGSSRLDPLRDLPILPGHRPVADLPSRADLYEEMFDGRGSRR